MGHILITRKETHHTFRPGLRDAGGGPRVNVYNDDLTWWAAALAAARHADQR